MKIRVTTATGGTFIVSDCIAIGHHFRGTLDSGDENDETLTFEQIA